MVELNYGEVPATRLERWYIARMLSHPVLTDVESSEYHWFMTVRRHILRQVQPVTLLLNVPPVGACRQSVVQVLNREDRLLCPGSSHHSRLLGPKHGHKFSARPLASQTADDNLSM